MLQIEVYPPGSSGVEPPHLTGFCRDWFAGRRGSNERTASQHGRGCCRQKVSSINTRAHYERCIPSLIPQSHKMIDPLSTVNPSGWHKHPAESGQIIPKFPRVADVDRISLPPFHRPGYVLPADSRLDYGNNQSILPGHPDLFYDGIHGCEILFTIMGPACRTVSRVKGDTADLVTGVWNDGRVGTFRGILRGHTAFGATVFGEKGIAPAGRIEDYESLFVEIATFFKTGQPPMSVENTLEIYAFLEAADQSLRQGGCPVSVQSVLEKARKQADARRKP